MLLSNWYIPSLPLMCILYTPRVSITLKTPGMPCFRETKLVVNERGTRCQHHLFLLSALFSNAQHYAVCHYTARCHEAVEGARLVSRLVTRMPWATRNADCWRGYTPNKYYSTIPPSIYKPNTVPILVTPCLCSPGKLAAFNGGPCLLKANQ